MKPVKSQNKSLREFLHRKHYSFAACSRPFFYQGKGETLARSLLEKFHLQFKPPLSKFDIQHFDYFEIGTIELLESEDRIEVLDGKRRLAALFLLLITSAPLLKSYVQDFKLIGDMTQWRHSAGFGQAFNLDLEGMDEKTHLAIFSGQLPDPPLSDAGNALLTFSLDIRNLLNETGVIRPEVLHLFIHWVSTKVIMQTNTRSEIQVLSPLTSKVDDPDEAILKRQQAVATLSKFSK